MARLRYNGLTATLGAGLASGDTTITFTAALTHSGGTAVPTVAGTDYIPLTILASSDPDSAVKEIIWLTAYTSGATTGTIARGKEGTTGDSHSSGVVVVHGPTLLDFAGSHAEFTSSFTSTVGLSNVGTPVIDSAKSTDTSFVTPGADGTFTIAAAGVYDLHGFIQLVGTAWSGNPRVFADITIGGTTRARSPLVTTSSEDAFTVAAPGVYVGASDTIKFTYYRSAGTGSVTLRYFLTKIG